MTHILSLVRDFSSVHHDSLRNTMSWERVVEDDCVRSVLRKLKSFLLSKYTMLMFFPLLDGTMKNAVCPNQLCPDRSWDPQASRILSVFCPNFVLPVSILN